jgi:hypothetical protein
MSELKRCHGCKGQKKLPGLGGIKIEDCRDCNGIGWIKELDESVQPQEAPAVVLKAADEAVLEKPKKKSKKKSKTKQDK